jgi:hypothetical protein
LEVDRFWDVACKENAGSKSLTVSWGFPEYIINLGSDLSRTTVLSLNNSYGRQVALFGKGTIAMPSDPGTLPLDYIIVLNGAHVLVESLDLDEISVLGGRVEASSLSIAFVDLESAFDCLPYIDLGTIGGDGNYPEVYLSLSRYPPALNHQEILSFTASMTQTQCRQWLNQSWYNYDRLNITCEKEGNKLRVFFSKEEYPSDLPPDPAMPTPTRSIRMTPRATETPWSTREVEVIANDEQTSITSRTSDEPPLELIGTGTIVAKDTDELILPKVVVPSNSNITAVNLYVSDQLNIVGGSLAAAEDSAIHIEESTIIELVAEEHSVPFLDLGQIGETYTVVPQILNFDMSRLQIDKEKDFEMPLIRGNRLSNCAEWLQVASRIMPDDKFTLECREGRSISAGFPPVAQWVQRSMDVLEDPLKPENPLWKWLGGVLGGTGVTVAIASIKIVCWYRDKKKKDKEKKEKGSQESDIETLDEYSDDEKGRSSPRRRTTAHSGDEDERNRRRSTHHRRNTDHSDDEKDRDRRRSSHHRKTTDHSDDEKDRDRRRSSHHRKTTDHGSDEGDRNRRRSSHKHRHTHSSKSSDSESGPKSEHSERPGDAVV